MAISLRAVSPAFGLSLTEEEALLLAQVGDMRLTFEQLVAKAQVQRAVPGTLPVSPDGQQMVAVGEVLAQLQGTVSTAEDLRLLRAQLVRRQLESERVVQVAEGVASKIEALVRERDHASRAQRRFNRNATLLRMQQRNRLQAEIVDPGRREDALRRLDDVYLQFLTEAHDIVMRS